MYVKKGIKPTGKPGVSQEIKKSAYKKIPVS